MTSIRRHLKATLYLIKAAIIAVLLASCQSTETPNLTNVNPVRVITSGGFAAAFDILALKYTQDHGIELITAYGSSSGGATDSIPSRLARNEVADVIILSRTSLDNLARLGYVIPEGRVDLVHSKIGMAIRSGAAKQDISTPEAFVRVLLNAESIGYSASASGAYLSTVLWPKIGLWKRIKSKSRRILSQRVASVVARGEVDIGFQQISEILSVQGADYAGPIPDEYQKVTVFSAGVVHTAPNPEGAKKLLNYLSSVAVAPVIAATGLQPVAQHKPQ